MRDVKDPKEAGPDGTPIDARLQGIAEQTANDIKNCANACDTYAKKRLVVRVLKGPVWESRFLGFVSVFTKRRGQFEEALAIHTARALDSVQASVFVMKMKLDSIDDKYVAEDISMTFFVFNSACCRLEMFSKVFQKFASPEELKITDKVKGKGDIKAIQKNDALLRDLNEYENGLETRSDERGKRSAYSMKDLRDELQEDFQLAIEKNLDTFEGKFVLYHRQLKDELSKFIADENVRLLRAVREGPHDRIRNEVSWQMFAAQLRLTRNCRSCG